MDKMIIRDNHFDTKHRVTLDTVTNFQHSLIKYT